MLIYLDMCCLKRPFDDQTQMRIRLESEAVLALLSMESATLQFARSGALLLENSYNPVKDRAARVHQWLTNAPTKAIDLNALRTRSSELMQWGFKNFDALHVGSAELARADLFGTVDDRLLAAAMRNKDRLHVRVAPILDVVKEVSR
jgi:hypothetical protein